MPRFESTDTNRFQRIPPLFAHPSARPKILDIAGFLKLVIEALEAAWVLDFTFS
jgi:hypothetical protein